MSECIQNYKEEKLNMLLFRLVTIKTKRLRPNNCKSQLSSMKYNYREFSAKSNQCPEDKHVV